MEAPQWILAAIDWPSPSEWLSSPVIAALVAGIFVMLGKMWWNISNKLEDVKNQNLTQEKKIEKVEQKVDQAAQSTADEMNGKLKELLQARERLAFMEGLHQGEASANKQHADLAAIATEMAFEVIIQIDGGRGVIVRCSESITRLLGWLREELIGQPLTKIIPERYREKHLKAMATYTATGKKTMDWSSVKVHALTPSGAEIPVEISFSELQAGNERRFVGVIKRRAESGSAPQASFPKGGS